MNISAPFIERPIATALLMVGLLLGGLAAYPLLPVAALPNINYPTLQVTAQLPGADPQTMASSVATPLELQFGQIPGLIQMTSASALGFTQITLQFDLSRAIDGAATDTLSAINAAAAQLPLGIPYPPTIRKVNPADTPILVLGITSDTLPLTVVDAYAENILLPKMSQISGVGLVGIGGQQKPAIRVQVDPQALAARSISLEDVRNVISQANVDQPKGTLNSPRQTYTLNTNDQLLKPSDYDSLILAYRNGSPVRVRDVGKAIDAPENDLIAGWYNHQRAIIMAIQRQPGANVIETVARVKAMLPVLRASIPSAMKVNIISDRTETIRASVSDVQFTLLLTVALVVMVIFLLLAQFLGHDYSRRHRAAVPDRHFCGALRIRLQPRQPLADGALDRGRLRGRRCGRGHREHRAASGGGGLAVSGGPQRRGRDRLHHRFDHAVADRGVHSVVPHGGVCRPLVPRICGHGERGAGPLAADLPDAHPDDVRPAAQAAPRGARMALPPVRTRLRRPAQPL
jgi:hypothetical protein